MIKVGVCRDIGSLLFGFAETEGSRFCRCTTFSLHCGEQPSSEGAFIILVFSSIKEKNDRARNDNTAAVWLKPADLISLLKKKAVKHIFFKGDNTLW